MSAYELDFEKPLRTLAHWLSDLGDIPPDRVIFPDHPGPATEEDVVTLCNSIDKRRFELIDGVLVEKVLSFPKAVLTPKLLAALHEFVVPELGVVLGFGYPVRLFPGRVRFPDAAVCLWDRIPEDESLNQQIFGVAPNFVADVLAPGNTPREMQKKREDYFGAGVQLVWEVMMEDECVRVYSDVDSFVTLTIADELSGEPVLPGFRFPVKSLFED